MRLRPEDADRVIAGTRSDNAVLIGGQAVAFWCKRFGIEPRVPALTEDIDYLGTKAAARKVSAQLKLRHKLKIATLEDQTPSSALLQIELNGYPEPVLVDYLASVIGVASKAIEKSAVVVEFEGKSVRIIHPLLLLQTKIWNLYQLEGKRTKEGIEQARLAIQITAAFVEAARMEQRALLDTIEAIAKFAATAPARYAAKTFKLDCLNAIPRYVFEGGVLPAAFHEKRWPQILASTA
jgi:hypothetical protein